LCIFGRTGGVVRLGCSPSVLGLAVQPLGSLVLVGVCEGGCVWYTGGVRSTSRKASSGMSSSHTISSVGDEGALVDGAGKFGSF